MALIIDPDNLNQGDLNIVADLAFTLSGTGAANRTVITGATTLPVLADNEFFEIRKSSTPGNNGLYRVNDASPTTSAITIEKIVGTDPVNLVAESTDCLGTTGVASEKSVHLDVPTLTFYLLEQGNLSVNGVTMLAIHSFFKKRWKDDQSLMDSAAFPMIGISFAAGQWQFGVDPSGNNSGWKPAEDDVTEVIKTRRLIRNAGWDELDSTGVILRKFFNVTTLGTFEDAVNDKAHYRFGSDATDLTAAIDFEFAGPVNEPVQYFREFGNPASCAFGTTSTITRATGSFLTDGYQIGGQVTIRTAEDVGNNGSFVLTAVAALTLTVTGTPLTVNAADTTAQLAVDNDNAFTTFLRIRDGDTNGKTFAQADLAAAGETGIISKKIPFGLSNVTDLDISASDATIASTPYTEVLLRYLSGAYNRDVDTVGTPRNFGIVLDVGTYSQNQGVSAVTAVFTSANIGTITLGNYTGGTLTIHEGTDKGVHTISGTPVNNAGTLEVTLTVALTAVATNLSFTLQRTTPIVATREQIYEKTQFQLRQAADIDDTSNVVNGKTADGIMVFEGANLRVGKLAPTNPNGGGSGVFIEGFDSNDTNNLFFFDNGAVQRAFPFVSAGTFTFNQLLVDDTDGEFWLYFEYTRRTTNSDIDVVAPAGSTYDLEGTLGTYVVNDYLQISGFAQAENNGLFIVTVVNVSGSDYTVRKVDGSAVGTLETNQTVSVDENPYPSPQAILVDNNAGADIVGAISALTAAFDFDYDNNVQGGRTAATNANVVLVAAGAEKAQVAVVKGLIITRATGLAFSILPAQERNFTP
ncbi:MAG: hypothetical protein ABGX83_05530 [Nitrospira sp.]